jgi:hypothetical protein
MPPQPLSIRQNSLLLPCKNKHFFILHFQQPKFTGFSATLHLANYDFFYIQEFGYCLAGNGPYAEWCDRKLVYVCRVGRNDRTYMLTPQGKIRQSLTSNFLGPRAFCGRYFFVRYDRKYYPPPQSAPSGEA